jgi:hypothetical protein
MPMPAFALRLLGDLADELLLGGQQVLPDKALESGFQFRHETLRSALAAMLPRHSQPPTRQILKNERWFAFTLGRIGKERPAIKN